MTNSVISHYPSNRIRRGWLKHLGMKINGSVMFYEDYHIRNPKGITIEDGVSIGPKILLDGRKGLHIGKSAVIAYEVLFGHSITTTTTSTFVGKLHP